MNVYLLHASSDVCTRSSTSGGVGTMEGNELTSIARSVVDAAVSDQGRLDNDRFDD